MSWFTDIEKKIADKVAGAFTKAEDLLNKAEHVIIDDVKGAFEQSRQAALDANVEVNTLKAQLQDALVRARDLHQAAVDAANAAVAAAEADVVRFKAAAAAHAADLATQASQIIQ
jgi:cell division septum initiation protein DivIVA